MPRRPDPTTLPLPGWDAVLGRRPSRGVKRGSNTSQPAAGTQPARPPRHRAERESTPAAKPFLKWAGGKRQLLGELLPRVPRSYQTFHEPFLGGGALFFALRPPRALLSDANPRLIRTYQAIRDRVEDVIALLRTYPYDSDFYYRLRSQLPDHEEPHVLAAWMLYLNRAGYNGLYRVNSRNEFNVPFGRYTNPKLCDAENLRACSAALRGVELRVEDFEAVLERARPGDFVYFDPPYAPLNATSSFTSYTGGGFGPAEQARLRDVARQLKARKVHVLLSNSSAPLIRDLYADGFLVEEVLAARNVNSKAERRGKLVELLVR